MVQVTLSNSEITLLNLLKESMFGVPFLEAQDVDWNKVLLEAKNQAVVGLVADSATAENKDEWKKIAAGNTANSIRYLHAQNDLISLFQNHDIPLIILKGAAAAVYYPVPIKRTMGDIDFIVPIDRFDDACKLMLENGYIQKKGDLKEIRHKSFSKGETHYELHHHFSYTDLDIEKYITDGFKQVNQGNINGIVFPMLPKLANGLILLAHMRNHLQSGLGLRQVIDWMMYVDKELDDLFWEQEFMRVSKTVKLDKFAIAITRMCQLHLGLKEELTWCKRIDINTCDRLLNIIISYGNFGSKHGEGNKVETVTTRIRHQGLFHYLQINGEGKWELYHRHNWLKPLCWIYMICRLISKGIKSGRKQNALNDIKLSNERYELLKQLEVV